MFDRFDVCEAFLALEMDWNDNGRISGRARTVSAQLHRIQFRPAPSFRGLASLSANAREVYKRAVLRYGLATEGYCDCACRDCMNGPIVGLAGVDMCDECQRAECELGDHECKAPGAYCEPCGEAGKEFCDCDVEGSNNET